jgi:hypothetical protein
MKVCWQLTGFRKDPPQEEQGRYLQPDLYSAPEEQSVMRARMGEEWWRAMMREAPPSFEPPQVPAMPPRPPEMPPGAPPMPPGVAAPGFGRMEEERWRQIDELRRQIEELRRQR